MPPFNYNRYKRESLIMLAICCACIAIGFAGGYASGSDERSYAEFKVAVCD